jgi:hypothetical protein
VLGAAGLSCCVCVILLFWRGGKIQFVMFDWFNKLLPYTASSDDDGEPRRILRKLCVMCVCMSSCSTRDSGRREIASAVVVRLSAPINIVQYIAYNISINATSSPQHSTLL